MHDDSLALVRRRVLAAAMIAAPLLLIFAGILWASTGVDEGNAAQALKDTVHAFGRNAAANIFRMLAFLTLIPASLGLWSFSKGRGAWWAFVGTALVIVGAMFTASSVGLELAVALLARQMNHLGTLDSLTPAYDKVQSGPVFGGIFVISAVGVCLGLILHGIGLVVERREPLWTAGAIIAGAAVMFVAGPIGAPAVFIAGAAVLLPGLGMLGSRLLTSNEAPVRIPSGVPEATKR